VKGYADGHEAYVGIASWCAFYNTRRPHQALGNRTPIAVCWPARRAGCGHDGQRKSVANMPTAATTATAVMGSLIW
jgi:Integrase core domain